MLATYGQIAEKGPASFHLPVDIFLEIVGRVSAAPPSLQQQEAIIAATDFVSQVAHFAFPEFDKTLRQLLKRLDPSSALYPACLRDLAGYYLKLWRAEKNSIVGMSQLKEEIETGTSEIFPAIEEFFAAASKHLGFPTTDLASEPALEMTSAALDYVRVLRKVKAKQSVPVAMSKFFAELKRTFLVMPDVDVPYPASKPEHIMKLHMLKGLLVPLVKSVLTVPVLSHVKLRIGRNQPRGCHQTGRISQQERRIHIGETVQTLRVQRRTVPRKQQEGNRRPARFLPGVHRAQSHPLEGDLGTNPSAEPGPAGRRLVPAAAPALARQTCALH